MYYDSAQGNLNCCSETAIAFHYVMPTEMRFLDFLINKLHPFGLEKNSTKTLPEKFELSEIRKASDAESFIWPIWINRSFENQTRRPLRRRRKRL